jgi:hypothetical protein
MIEKKQTNVLKRLLRELSSREVYSSVISFISSLPSVHPIFTHGVETNLCRPALEVTGLLIRVDMPHDVVRQTDDLVASTLRHLCEAFGFGLVLKRVAREVDACGHASVALVVSIGWGGSTGTVNIRFDENIDTTNTIELDLLIWVLVAVSHQSHVLALGVVLCIALGENSVLGKAGRKLQSLWRLLP